MTVGAATRIVRRVAALDEGRCTGCRLCLPTCDSRALIWVTADAELFLDAWACTGCGACIAACPESALHLNEFGRV
jgi:heterodisulfide reductase subunit A